MRTYRILLLMLLLPVLVFAQETPVCKIDGEVMPDWVCHSESSDDFALYGVGIGNSYNQAIAFALCNINQNYSVEISEVKKNDYIKGRTQTSKNSFGNNIIVATVLKKYSTAKNIEVDFYRCKVGIQANEEEISIDEKIIETSNNKEISTKNESKYDIPSGLEIQKSLVDNGVEILKTFISKKHGFYVLVRIQKSLLRQI